MVAPKGGGERGAGEGREGGRTDPNGLAVMNGRSNEAIIGQVARDEEGRGRERASEEEEGERSAPSLNVDYSDRAARAQRAARERGKGNYLGVASLAPLVLFAYLSPWDLESCARARGESGES